MRVFVTGATGFIGSAVVKELTKAGHQVLGLARSEASAQTLIAAGAEVHHGSLDNLQSLKDGASKTDGVIHTAFIHDFSKFKENCEIDRHAIEALSSGLAGSNRPLIITSGIGLLSTGRINSEDDNPVSTAASIPRVASEEAANAALSQNINISIMRLPPSVHGRGDHGFVPRLIEIAKEKGVSAYVGEGLNRWPAVHRLDAAQLFRLALEKSGKGARYHAVADEGVSVKVIAEIIGRRLDIPVVSKTPQEAAEHFGWIAYFVQMDCPSSNANTRKNLGWQPTESSLIEDIDSENYFPH